MPTGVLMLTVVLTAMRMRTEMLTGRAAVGRRSWTRGRAATAGRGAVRGLREPGGLHGPDGPRVPGDRGPRDHDLYGKMDGSADQEVKLLSEGFANQVSVSAMKSVGGWISAVTAVGGWTSAMQAVGG